MSISQLQIPAYISAIYACRTQLIQTYPIRPSTARNINQTSHQSSLSSPGHRLLTPRNQTFKLPISCKLDLISDYRAHIYQHEFYFFFIRTYVSNFSYTLMYHDYVSDCCDRHPGHESILPYFYGDFLLDKTLERLEAEEDSGRATMLRKAIECTRKQVAVGTCPKMIGASG